MHFRLVITIQYIFLRNNQWLVSEKYRLLSNLLHNIASIRTLHVNKTLRLLIKNKYNTRPFN